MIIVFGLIGLFALYEIVVHFEAIVMYLIWSVVFILVFAVIDKSMLDTGVSFVLTSVLLYVVSVLFKKANHLFKDV